MRVRIAWGGAALLAAATAGAGLGDVHLVNVDPTHQVLLDAEALGTGSVAVGRLGRGPWGNDDAWVLRLGASGDVLASQAIGGERHDRFDAVAVTRDGGYLASGISHSFGGTDAKGWLVRFDAAGAVLWQRTYVVGASDFANLPCAGEAPRGLFVAGTLRTAPERAILMSLGPDGGVDAAVIVGGVDGENVFDCSPTSEGTWAVVGRTSGAGRFDDAMILEAFDSTVLRRQYAWGSAGSNEWAEGSAPRAVGGAIVVGRGMSSGFAAAVDLYGSVDWSLAWQGGRLGAARELADGSVLAGGDVGSQPWLVSLSEVGVEQRQRLIDGGGEWHSIVDLAGGGLQLAGGHEDGLLGLTERDLGLREPCPAPVPPVPAAPLFELVELSLRQTVASAVSEISTASIADTPAIVTSACPQVPAEPQPLLVTQGPGLILAVPLSPAAQAWNVYEGTIGAFRDLPLRRCALRESDGTAVVDAGRVSLAHAASSQDAWFLVSSSNVAFESGLGRGSDGPLDEPPSPWRCGPSP